MSDLIETLQNIVDDAGFIDSEDLAGHSAGLRDDRPLKARALIRPKTTEQVSAVLRACNQAGQAVITVGGMTGLVDGHRSGDSDIVMSMQRMNTISEVDTRTRTLEVEAGAILQNVQEKAAQAGLMFALDLGARASCTIGGNIATNAGGVRVLRYGMMRDLLLGVEAVLADGRVISSMFKVLKNNTGYDLRQLFVGSEGTLGVVTRAVLRLHEAPQSIETALLAIPCWQSVMSLLRRFDAALTGRLIAFEVLWQNYYALNTGAYSDVDAPLSDSAGFYVLLDVNISNGDSDKEQLESILMQSLNDGLAVNGILASSESERHKFWQIREIFEPEQRKFGLVYGYDISLPIEAMPEYVDTVSRNLKAKFADAELFSYGHIGDGNLHFTVAPGAARDHSAIDEIVYQPLRELKGSISAEHGVGIEKKKYLNFTRSQAEIDLMRQLKNMMDPNNILNPGKIFDV